MDTRTFAAEPRTVGTTPRRRSLLLLGVAGLATALARPTAAPAAKKGKKKCKKEKKQCRQTVQDLCADLGSGEQECLDGLLPCCDSCKVGSGVRCTAEAFLSM